MHRLKALTHLVSDPTPAHLVEAAVILVLAVVVIRYLFRVDPIKLIVIGVALEVFSGNWKYMSIPLPLDRVLMGIGMFGILFRGARSVSDRRLVLRPIHFVMLGISVYVFLNGLWAGTVLHSYGFYSWLDRLGVIPFLIFTLSPHLFATERQRNLLLVSMLVLGSYLGIEGLAEAVGVHALELPHYITNQSLGITTGRVRGPFVASDAMGISLFDCAVFAAIALTRWTGRWSRRICYAVMALSALDIFFTLTRAVWLGAALAMLVTMVSQPRLRRYVPAVLGGGAALVVVLLFTVPGLSAKVEGRVHTVSSVWDRYNTNYAALRAIADHPLFGLGWQTFETKGILYLREAGTYPLTGVGLEVHNVFLSHAAELGIPAAIVWALLLISAVGGGSLRRVAPDLVVWRTGLLAMAVLFFVCANFIPLSYPFPNLVIWLMAGLVARDRHSVRVHGEPVHGAVMLPLVAA